MDSFFFLAASLLIISKHFSYNRDVDRGRFIENMKETKMFNDTSGSEITLSEKCAGIRYDILQKLNVTVYSAFQRFTCVKTYESYVSTY